MPSYYKRVEGNLIEGDIAKASDINEIQDYIEDALQGFMGGLHDQESFILGSGEEHKDDFILTLAKKTNGEYLDSYNIDFQNNEEDWININHETIRKPIIKTKSSTYSIVAKFKNTSDKDVPITCRLENEDGEFKRTNIITLAANTTDDYEIIFDLDYCPAPPGIDFENLKDQDGEYLPAKLNEKYFDEGFRDEHNEEKEHRIFTAGVSKFYFIIEAPHYNAIDLAVNGDEETTFDPYNSLGVCCKTGSDFAPDKEIYLEIENNGTFQLDQQKRNLYYKDIYAKGTTYECSGGTAIVGGEPVKCLDTHITVEGGSTYGNLLTQVYMDDWGHLRSIDKEVLLSTNPDDFSESDSDRPPLNYLKIALILTYSSALYDSAKEPLVIQDGYGQRPRSHHERIRRLEKQVDWTQDKALPGRIKWNLTGTDMLQPEEEIDALFNYPMAPSDSEKDDPSKKDNTKDVERIKSVYTTTDENGDVVVKFAKEEVETLTVTLKEKTKDEKGKNLKLEKTDSLNVSTFGTIKNMKHDSKKGTLILDEDSKKKTTGFGMNAKQAKETEFNPWDDSAANRPSDEKVKKRVREYTVHKGKNDAGDKDSSYPGMTFYTPKNFKMKKLEIPLRKFKDCSGVKFFIYKRQTKNNKTNQVDELEKLIWHTKEYSLKKAKQKGKYQYMDNGFIINFGENGKTFPKGQYIIIAVPIPKSKKGSCFVETFKPKNSKDFCIEYHGTANAEHFTYFKAYQEVWYNSAKAVGEEKSYNKKGWVTSKVKSWAEKKPVITKVKPIINKNHLKTEKGESSYKLYVKTGSKWDEVKPNKVNTVTSGSTFQWKIEFYSKDGSHSPELKYVAKDKYAIKFQITRSKSGAGVNQTENFDKAMCITSKIIDGNDVLRQYVGDMNLSYKDANSRFEGYEFARIWANRDLNEKLLVDIQASDRNYKYKLKEKVGDQEVTKNYEVPLWTTHYCDLTLDDFTQENVDYSNYIEPVEEDENNLKLKLDSNYTYNDNDIQISSLDEFEKQENVIDSNKDSKIMTFVNNTELNKNQIFLKNTFKDYKDLSKYTGLNFTFDIGSQTDEASLKGLAIYISGQAETDVPSDITKREEITDTPPLSDDNIIPDVIDPDESSYSWYDGKIIEINHHIDKTSDGNKAYKTGYYKYVQEYDTNKQKYVYKLQQIHDIRSFNLYKISEIKYKKPETATTTEETSSSSSGTTGTENSGTETAGTENSGTETTGTNDSTAVSDDDEDIVPSEDSTTTSETIKNPNTYTVRIEIDQDSNILKRVKEIGIITLNDEDVTPTTSTTGEVTRQSQYSVEGENFLMELKDVAAISEEALTIFDPEKHSNLIKVPDGVENIQDHVIAHEYNKMQINESTYYPGYNKNAYPELNDKNKTTKGFHKTTPYTSQITIKKAAKNLINNHILCYINNPFEGGVSKYKHMGVQIACDVYLPKDSIKINLCAGLNGEDVITSLNLPTLNTIFSPIDGEWTGKINLSQVFKKIDSEEKVQSISISAAGQFWTFVEKTTDKRKPAINLFLGKIVLYRARTIPIYHNKLRFKFYSTTDGKIDYTDDGDFADENEIEIRKIGAVLDYH